MNNLRPVAGLGLLGVLLLTASSAAAQEKSDVQVVKYAGLAEVVLQNRGKVVLVDVWHLN